MATCFPDGVGKKDKLVVIGTPIADLAMAITKPQGVKPPSDDAKPKEVPLQEETKHQKILEKGLPDGAEVGNSMDTLPFPEAGLKGILSHMGKPIRLTFKVFTCYSVYCTC